MICCQEDEWAAEHHRSAEVERLVGEVARVAEALVMDEGGSGDVADLQPGADAAADRRMVAEPHAAVVVEAEPLAPLAVDVAVSPSCARLVAAVGEVAEPARLFSSKSATSLPAEDVR